MTGGGGGRQADFRMSPRSAVKISRRHARADDDMQQHTQQHPPLKQRAGKKVQEYCPPDSRAFIWRLYSCVPCQAKKSISCTTTYVQQQCPFPNLNAPLYTYSSSNIWGMDTEIEHRILLKLKRRRRPPFSSLSFSIPSVVCRCLDVD